MIEIIISVNDDNDGQTLLNDKDLKEICQYEKRTGYLVLLSYVINIKMCSFRINSILKNVFIGLMKVLCKLIPSSFYIVI